MLFSLTKIKNFFKLPYYFNNNCSYYNVLIHTIPIFGYYFYIKYIDDNMI